MEWLLSKWSISSKGGRTQRTREIEVFMVYVWVERWWSGGVEWMRVRCLMLVVFSPMLHEYARASRFIARREPSVLTSILIFWSYFVLKSSGVFNYSSLLLLDSWTELRASIIVLATVEWLYIPFALSSVEHGLILLDILWYGLLCPNDWCCKHQIKDHGM